SSINHYGELFGIYQDDLTYTFEQGSMELGNINIVINRVSDTFDYVQKSTTSLTPTSNLTSSLAIQYKIIGTKLHVRGVGLVVNTTGVIAQYIPQNFRPKSDRIFFSKNGHNIILKTNGEISVDNTAVTDFNFSFDIKDE
ncbi:hypothetical protein, partial [Zhouia amylolytica]|uniref:hypothetical protein n=1 Tax=Zhouia amylolytica TaxID=376730 RepID=UPI0020CEB7BD